MSEIEQQIVDTPKHPGYYWAKWKIASPGTLEASEQTPSNFWEIVQVWENCSDPNSDEQFGVSVPGVQVAQWPDQFFWGPKVAEYDPRSVDDYVAWCRFTRRGEIITCDSDAPNAFRVYRHPALPAPPPEPATPVEVTPGVPAELLLDMLADSDRELAALRERLRVAEEIGDRMADHLEWSVKQTDGILQSLSKVAEVTMEHQYFCNRHDAKQSLTDWTAYRAQHTQLQPAESKPCPVCEQRAQFAASITSGEFREQHTKGAKL